VSLVMGSYGIGLGRLLAAVVERHHDADGVIWPPVLAPYAATVLMLGAEADLASVAEEVVEQLAAAGLDGLYDDRAEWGRVKLKDADLIGIPLRIAVGRRGLADGSVERKRRPEPTTQLVPIRELAALVRRGGGTGGPASRAGHHPGS
jgi:prolyl-tRNA synthetase